MKITQDKIDKVCDLYYNDVKVIPIGLNEHICEKSVRKILKENYTPAYVKVREELTRIGLDSTAYLSLMKMIANRDQKSDTVMTPQDVNNRESEYQRLSEKLEKFEEIFAMYEGQETKLQKIKSKYDTAIRERDSAHEIVAEKEKVTQEQKQQIQDLTRHHLNEHLLLQNNMTEVNTTIHQGFNGIEGKIESLTKDTNQFFSLFKTHETLTTQHFQTLEDTLKTLKADPNNEWIIYGAAGGIGVCIGAIITSFVLPYIKDSIPWSAEQIINFINGFFSKSHPVTSSGLMPEINTSGTLYSGISSFHPGQTYGAGFNTLSNQQQRGMQPEPHNQVDLVTNPSCLPSSRGYVSSHLETIAFTSHVETPVQIPSSFQIPFNYPFIPLPSPLPDDLSEVYPMNKWRRLTGPSFEICIEKLFVHKGYPTERLPYGNIAGDQIVTVNGVPTVAECKQKPKVGVDTIQRTRAAMEHYRYRGVTRCMVITTGEFTKDAREEAQNIGVEIWDGKRLLEEIYKAQFFYVPENASDYDPNK